MPCAALSVPFPVVTSWCMTTMSRAMGPHGSTSVLIVNTAPGISRRSPGTVEFIPGKSPTNVTSAPTPVEILHVLSTICASTRTKRTTFVLSADTSASG